uniref:Uncharacterized protein n=1 Tax=Onchocerca volvulus TaxID=6282 RepID=A0A8R1XY49_ONCVO
MLPIYFILILIFVGLISSVRFGLEPQFSPLTPYQTADSLPPPVYGLLEDQLDTSKLAVAKGFQIPQSTENRKNYYDKEQEKTTEISGLSSQKRLSPVSSKNVQSKNWKMPPGAKLVGYNVQLIAGYIPTTYIEKNDEEKLELGNSESSSDIYSKYLPGYDMIDLKQPIDKNYDVNQRIDEMDTITAPIDWLETDTSNELFQDQPIVQRNFSQREIRFPEKREDSVDSASTTEEIVSFDSFLWPVTEAESKVEKQKEEGIFINEMDYSTAENSTKFGVTNSFNPIKYDLLILKKTTVKPNSQNIRDRLEEKILNDSIFKSTVTNNSTEEGISRIASGYDIDETTPFNLIFRGRENAKKSQLAISQKTNLSMKRRNNDEMVENSTSTSEMLDRLRKTEPKISSLQQFDSPKLQIIQQTTPVSEGPVETEMSQISPRILLPEININNDALVQQNNTEKNRSRIDTIISMVKPSGHESGVKNIRELSDIQIVNQANLQNSTSIAISNDTIIAQTTTINVDSYEFDDEDYEKEEKNENHENNFDSFSITPVTLKLENPVKFSTIQPANEQRYEMNEKLNFDQNSRNVNDSDGHEESFLGAESPPNDRNDDDELSLTDEKNNAEKQNNEDINSKNKVNFRDDYDEKDNDDVVYDDNDDNKDNDNDEYDPKVIKENDEDMLGLQENSQEKKGPINGPIFSPDQIPSFEEWLSSLPIQPAFPFTNAKNGIQNHQSSVNHFPMPFLGPFKGNRRGEIKDDESNEQEEQSSDINFKKKRRFRIHDYDNSEENDKDQRFVLSKNVPYK